MTKLNAAGSVLVYSTYLGGDGDDGGRGIAVDASGNAYVTGLASDRNFPAVDPVQPFTGEDAFVAKITDTPPRPPILPANSVVSAASFRPATQPNSAIAPGAIVALFGTDLASDTQVPTAVPLPTAEGCHRHFQQHFGPAVFRLRDADQCPGPVSGDDRRRDSHGAGEARRGNERRAAHRDRGRIAGDFFAEPARRRSWGDPAC